MSRQALKKEEIPVVILCGGRGTRLKEETEVTPKPLVPIGEHPILWHIMKIYGAQGFRKFVLLVGYKGEQIKDYFYKYPVFHSDFTIHLGARREQKIIYLDQPKEDWEVTILDTGLHTQTGARLRKAEAFLKAKTFMLTYGDGVANIDLDRLLKFHYESGKVATVTGVRPPARFGAITVKSGVAFKFREKAQGPGSYINGGFFAVDRDVFQHMNMDESLSFEQDVLEDLAEKQQLAVYRHNGYWECMDTIRDVEFLNEEWQGGSASWKIWEG